MALTMYNNFIATGRAKCQCCGKQIAKGVMCIKAEGFRISGQCHKTCAGPIGDLIAAAKQELGGN